MGIVTMIPILRVILKLRHQKLGLNFSESGTGWDYAKRISILILLREFVNVFP